MKFNLYSLILATILNWILASEDSLYKHKIHSKSLHTTETRQVDTNNGKDGPKKKDRPINLNLPDALVYYQGWVKYYHYSNDTHYAKPPSLFQNNAFFHQRILKEKLSLRDKFGSAHIPDKASFFMVVYNQSISMYTQRKNEQNHLVDTLRISHIRDVPEDNVLNGGIRDNGNFPFGFCIEIVADIPVVYSPVHVRGSGLPETWIICAPREQDKDNLLSILIKLKVKHQRLENNGLRITTRDSGVLKNKKSAIGSLLASPLPKDEVRTGLGDLVDGYWILLNDWTQCSLKCGNGTSYQQWMCVPPKHGGKECRGPAVRQKACNTHPCPSVNALLTLVSKNEKGGDKDKGTQRNIIVKAGVFSNRPQRYSKCVIKENDAFVMIKVDGTTDLVRKPIRIMMNNMTISIFNDDNYEELFYSYILQNTKFVYSREHCCFKLEDTTKRSKICGYNEFCGPKNRNIWSDQWSRDFNLFKGACKSEMSINSVLNNVLATQSIQDEIKKKSGEIIDEVQLILNI